MATTFINFIQHLQHPTDATTAILVLAKQPPFSSTNFQEHRAMFDQMRPVISHLASLPRRPAAQTNIGSALKSLDRHHWKSSLFFQYDKNADANVFTKPLPVSTLPTDTPVF
jgi:hypothetical protein